LPWRSVGTAARRCASGMSARRPRRHARERCRRRARTTSGVAAFLPRPGPCWADASPGGVQGGVRTPSAFTRPAGDGSTLLVQGPEHREHACPDSSTGYENSIAHRFTGRIGPELARDALHRRCQKVFQQRSGGSDPAPGERANRYVLRTELRQPVVGAGPLAVVEIRSSVPRPPTLVTGGLLLEFLLRSALAGGPHAPADRITHNAMNTIFVRFSTGIPRRSSQPRAPRHVQAPQLPERSRQRDHRRRTLSPTRTRAWLAERPSSPQDGREARRAVRSSRSTAHRLARTGGRPQPRPRSGRPPVSC